MANNLTLSAASFDAATNKGFFGQALNGGEGIAPAGVVTAVGPFAASVRFLTNTTPTATQVICGQNQLFWIGYNSNGTLHFECGGGGDQQGAATIDSSAVPSTGVVHTATISWGGSSSTMTAILDGTVVGTTTIKNNVLLTGSDNGGNARGIFAIRGHGGFPGTYTFTGGEVDEVALFAADQFNSAGTPPSSAYSGSEANLIALWHLDGNGTDSKGSAVAPATAYTLSGPSSGTVGTASTAYTVAVSGSLSANVTITPSDGGGGGSFSPTTVTLPAGNAPASQQFTYTAASAGSKTISTTNSGSLTNPASLPFSAATSAGADVTIAANNSAILYNAGVWLVTSGSAKTINAGANFRTLFTGSKCVLNFDISANNTPLPQIYYRIDGVVWTQATLASTVTLTMPSSTTAWPHHYLEVVVKSTSEWLNYGASQGGSRWSPQNAAVVLTSMTLANGQTVSAPVALGQSVWIFGDSITEGYHSVANLASGTQDTDGSDALIAWAYRQRDLLGAEISIIGFGGAGLSVGGTLGVPSLPNSYNFLWSGQARSFTPAPDLIVINYGENDGSSSGDATFIANYKAVLSGLLAATPATTLIACMVPFSQRKAADITAAISQNGNSRVTRIDTSGMFNTTDSVDGQHPLGVASLGAIGPAVANKLRPLLQGVRSPWVHS